ncbi:adenosine deaminase [Cohnella endophytica]|uniref:adenosine deaminase n=1 Tax=Cohnella endophytica TaxID=2419778 RepID=A0A494Y3I7_9BACL|nr:adenosine deaminase [Cohnella endophytica]RKP57264.1 adenosine deaminase [Cohnella endophytica]
MDAYALLSEMPKVDLHVHLDGCIKPETLVRLALRQGMLLPTNDEIELLPFVQVGEDCTNLKEYLAKFDFVLPFLQTGEALEQVAYEVVEQAAEHRIKYIEVRFAPQLHRNAGLSVDETISRVIEGLRLGEDRFGVKARTIAICMRNHPAEANLEVVDAASRFIGRGLVAVDLAGDESSYPASLFREVFSLAREKSIPITIHAGEAGGPDNIEEAVLGLGASRIGHGVRLNENDNVFSLVREQRIPLELCPTSNIQTKAVEGWDAYPIREYFEQGILFTVNTDNPGVSGTDITKEYRLLAEKFGFTLREITTLILNGVEASFLEPGEKADLKHEFEIILSRLGVYDLKETAS